MANRITTIFDMDTKGGVRNLASLRSELAATQGVGGKFKVLSGAIGKTIQENLGPALMAGGAAAVAFGAKSVEAFQKTAIEAGKFADASGLAVEDASRWMEVAGDLGISTDTVSGMFNKLNKAIATGGPLLDQYGISVVKTADGQVDANATMLKAIDAVSKIQDPTKRAELASKLFGKSWTEASELVTKGADGVAAALADVSDAKVIDEEELKKARDLRAAMDNLKDAVEDVQLVVGEELVPVVQDAAENMLMLRDAAAKVDGYLPGWSRKVADEIRHGLDPISQGRARWEELHDRITSLGPDIESNLLEQADASLNLGDALTNLNTETEDYSEYTEYATEVAKAMADAQLEEAEAAKEALKRAQRLTEQYDEQRKRVDDLIAAKTELVGGEIAVRQAQRDAEQAAKDLDEVLKNHDTTLGEAGAAIDDTAEAYLNAAEQAAQFQADTMEANGTVVDAKTKNYLLRQELQRLADNTSGPLHDALMQMIADLNAIPTSKTVDIKVLANGRRVNVGGGLAIGGGIIQEGPSTGARGAQTAMSPGSGRVAAGGLTVNVTSLDAKQAGRQIVQALNEYKRSGGIVSF